MATDPSSSYEDIQGWDQGTRSRGMPQVFHRQKGVVACNTAPSLPLVEISKQSSSWQPYLRALAPLPEVDVVQQCAVAAPDLLV